MRDPAPGCFLIATTQLTDPNFRRSVVYLVAHGDEGSLGFIVNRPLAMPLGEIWGECPSGLHEAQVAAEGGPVERHKGLLIHREADLSQAAEMGAGLWVGGDLEALSHRWAGGADRAGPRLFLGHSGWSPGQLQQEITDGAWILKPGQLDPVLDRATDEDLWERLSRGGNGGLKVPSLN